MISIRVWNADKTGVIVYQVPPNSPHVRDVYDEIYICAKEYQKDVRAHNEQLHRELIQWKHISQMHKLPKDMYRHVMSTYLKRPLRPRHEPALQDMAQSIEKMSFALSVFVCLMFLSLAVPILFQFKERENPLVHRARIELCDAECDAGRRGPTGPIGPPGVRDPIGVSEQDYPCIVEGERNKIKAPF